MRTLHRLFAAEGESVAGLIRQRRLRRCRIDLADPAWRHQPVHRIARRWGFPDPAHFSRVFRAAHGMGPQAYRDLHTGSGVARIDNPTAPPVNLPAAD